MEEDSLWSNDGFLRVISATPTSPSMRGSVVVGGSGVGRSGESVRNEHGKHKTPRKPEDLVSEKDRAIADLMRVRGVGEKMANELYAKGVRSAKELADRDDVSTRVRLCAKYVDELYEEIPTDLVHAFAGWLETRLMLDGFQDGPAASVLDVILVGAHRRGMESAHDIDILVVYDTGATKGKMLTTQLEKEFASHKAYIGTLELGETHYTFIWRMGKKARLVDLYVCPNDEKGSTLLHTTGPSNFNVLMRKRAKHMSMLLSQHGLYKKDQRIASLTEIDIFEALGLDYISVLSRGTEDALAMVVKTPYPPDAEIVEEIVEESEMEEGGGKK